MRRVWMAALCAAGILGAGQAGAAILTSTVNGTVDGGTDTAGLFGTAGASLAGDAVQIVFTFDTSMGVAVYNEGGQTIFGDLPFTAVPGTATIEIESQTYSLGSPKDASIDTAYGPSFAAIVSQAIVGNSGGLVLFLSNSPLGPTTLFKSYDGAACSADPATCIGELRLPGDLDTTFSPTSFSVSSPGHFTISGAPEPTTWALMLIGFGAAGAALRRRRALA